MVGGVQLSLILKSRAKNACTLQALKSFCAALTSSASGFMIFADSFFFFLYQSRKTESGANRETNVCWKGSAGLGGFETQQRHWRAATVRFAGLDI